MKHFLNCWAMAKACPETVAAEVRRRTHSRVSTENPPPYVGGYPLSRLQATAMRSSFGAWRQVTRLLYCRGLLAGLVLAISFVSFVASAAIESVTMPPEDGKLWSIGFGPH